MNFSLIVAFMLSSSILLYHDSWDKTLYVLQLPLVELNVLWTYAIKVTATVHRFANESMSIDLSSHDTLASAFSQLFIIFLLCRSLIHGNTEMDEVLDFIQVSRVALQCLKQKME